MAIWKWCNCFNFFSISTLSFPESNSGSLGRRFQCPNAELCCRNGRKPQCGRGSRVPVPCESPLRDFIALQITRASCYRVRLTCVSSRVQRPCYVGPTKIFSAGVCDPSRFPLGLGPCSSDEENVRGQWLVVTFRDLKCDEIVFGLVWTLLFFFI